MADVTMPQLGETVTEGTITKWFKKVGDPVAVDEPLFEVSTDKVDTEVPSPTAGFISEIKVNEGDTVDVGVVIAVISSDAGAQPATPEPPAAAPAPAPSPKRRPPMPKHPHRRSPRQLRRSPRSGTRGASPAQAPAAAAAPAPAGDAGNKLLSPVVRRLVAEHGLDPAAITGTGAGGRITREDVLDHIDKHVGDGGVAPAPPAPAAPRPAAPAAPAAAPAPVAPRPAAVAPTAATGQREEIVTLPKIRKLTGDHMVMSLATSPHAFSVVEIDYENVDRVRRAHMDAGTRRRGSPSRTCRSCRGRSSMRSPSSRA